jgi:superfamily II DNA or RNA helicase
MLALWKHQQEALDAINNSFEDNDRCLLKMFCGTGKTRVILSLILEMKKNL